MLPFMVQVAPTSAQNITEISISFSARVMQRFYDNGAVTPCIGLEHVRYLRIGGTLPTWDVVHVTGFPQRGCLRSAGRSGGRSRTSTRSHTKWDVSQRSIWFGPGAPFALSTRHLAFRTAHIHCGPLTTDEIIQSILVVVAVRSSLADQAYSARLIYGGSRGELDHD